MDYLKESKKFITSHYVSSGVRITAGVVLPAIILSYFNLLGVGIVVSLGAMCVSTPDTPGPIDARRNSMLVCIAVIFIVALVTGIAVPHPVLLGVIIFVLCFVFAMIAVFGARVNSIGMAALLIMVLNVDRPHYGMSIIWNALYIVAGGTWYMMLSLLLYSFRPYKLSQQALGDCVIATSDYLRVRALFYEKEVNYENTYEEMLEHQIDVHQKQNLVRELLFKSRNIVKESTTTGRTLVIMFLDIVDLFERAITSHQDYKALHDYFHNTDILQRFHEFILHSCTELDSIGIAIQTSSASNETDALRLQLKDLQEYFETFRDRERTPQNVEGFISLRQILNSLEDITSRIYTLHRYTTYDKKLAKNLPSNLEYDKFISHEDYDPKLILDNFSFKSNTFRHALRLSIATTAGYIIANFFPLGHGYWIMLTIVVILKPAYSLTKQRNFQRLGGTIAGALIGFIILYFIQDNTAIFFIMLFLMMGTYSFLRSNYLISVILMTPYVLLLFHLISKTNFETVFVDRVIDTGIGSAIAFLANFMLIPSWEREQIKNYMALAIEDNMNYFNDIAGAFTGTNFTVTQYKLSRKNAFVSLANLSDAFTRMLSEPKNRQKNSKLIHQFVVLNHMLTSHIATLSSFVKPFSEKYKSPDFLPVIHTTLGQLKDASVIILQKPVNEESIETFTKNLLEKRVNDLLQKRREELNAGVNDTDTRRVLSELKSIVDQFNFISKIATDIKKICVELEEEAGS